MELEAVRRSGGSSSVNPERMLVIAGGAQHIWIKLRWEANHLRTAHERAPVDVVSLIYGAMNFAITAQALEDWVCKTLVRRDKRTGLNAAAYRRAIAAAVPMQPAFRDIANTAKHGQYRDDNWLGGTVELVHTVGFAGTAKEYVLIYHSNNGATQTSLEIFERATQQWLRYLTGCGLVGVNASEIA